MANIAAQLKKLANEIEKSTDKVKWEQVYDLPFEIGGEYFIRTVTYFCTGRVKDIVGKFLILEDVAMIGDTGRFHKFFDNPDSNLEVEPFGDRDVLVNTDAIVDASERKLLLEVK